MKRACELPTVIATAVCLTLVLSACGAGERSTATASAPTASTHVTLAGTGGRRRDRSPGAASTQRRRHASGPATRLPAPKTLSPFTRTGRPGHWHAAGRHVQGVPAVYETTLVPPGGSQAAGIAWMDTRLLAARLYSGSKSPGGGPYRYTAPVEPAQARSLVAAFNGGFMMDSAEGGYYTEGKTIVPLRAGAASLVIYAGGSLNIGAWGSDVRMTRKVVAVRQNLVPLVAGHRPTPQAASSDWGAWGATCGATSCAPTVPGIEFQWRSGAGVTANGALVYVQGPALDPLQVADLLVRAGVVRGMELDINPDWPIFATYDPAGANGLAAPANGQLLMATIRGTDTFFDAWWARDFVTMSARRP